MSLIDSAERERATDPSTSFIVQAPAGSGKTEILTQRYLRLLGTVSAPEQIIALTFTRKAANEMRERILVALQQVASGVPATSPHQQKTFHFAALALARNTAFDWQLLQQPHRLRVITIDSLCQTLALAIPLQSQHIHAAAVNDKPEALYLSAARACIQFAAQTPAYQSTLSTLLLHLDNRQDSLVALLSALLAKRDQWLALLYQARGQDKTTYEQALATIEHHALVRFKNTLSIEDADSLITLMQRFVAVVGEPHDTLRSLHDLSQLTHAQITRLTQILLTSQDTLRKAFDHHVGLKRGVCSDQDYSDLKTASQQLLAHLNESPDFLEALVRIKNLPTPSYDAEQWETLQALFTLLPLLVAHLNLSFTEHNCVDFTAIAQQALQALGDELAPTDLALYLDHRIAHILVDEFQDTSLPQFQLLQQLIQGWEPQDGRTLFVVGDPMQSIYRFRAAEVGLFLRTREQGIGAILLTPLELSCNFRSTQTIVEWVNTHFLTIFPSANDIESGAVAFHSSAVPQSLSAPHASPDSYIKAFQSESRAEEALALVDCVVNELDTYPHENIAILVRSRNQLRDIIHLLRQRNIPFQGVDMDLLANLPHLRDVWSLTQALLMPANRLAWLAVLRSPWCGLILSDLHCIANFAKSQSIYFALAQLDKIMGLSDDGRIRARFIYTVLHEALVNRHQHALVEWITKTLRALHLHHILDDKQQDDLEQYWLLLEKFECDGLIEDLTLFKHELSKLYSKHVTPTRLQIMTIHKSKGLEFDCVMLPGLGARSAASDTPLVRWLKLPTEQGELLLLSPMKAAHHEQCALYDYLGQLDAEKSHYERQRLLYVATTRAKKRLYLFDTSLTARAGTFRHCLKNQVFSDIESHVTDVVASDMTMTHLPPLFRLPLDLYVDKRETVRLDNSKPNLKLPTLSNTTTPRLIGIVAHELLQWICTKHPERFADIPWELALHQLRSLGFADQDLTAAHTQLHQQIMQLFNDPIGQWIIKHRADEQNEYALLVKHHEDMVTRIIDRTFSEEGIRWIIDFKTGREDTTSEMHHREQVNDYALLLAQRSPQTTKCGLYYLASGHWITW